MRRARDVLVVEDERVVREATRKVLAGEKLEVREAVDVKGAISELEESDFRLVLSDLMLPGASGFELIAWLGRRRPLTPVIAITGYATIANALESFRAGAFDFIPKPFDVGELLGVVRRGLCRFEQAARRGGTGTAEPRRSPPRPARPPEYLLGEHSWAGLEADGTAILGLGATFFELVEAVERVALPAVGERLAQGKCCTRIFAADQTAHRVWAPLGGNVIAVNTRLEEHPDLLIEEPFTGGWLLKIVPQNLELESQALSLTAGGGTV